MGLTVLFPSASASFLLIRTGVYGKYHRSGTFIYTHISVYFILSETCNLYTSFLSEGGNFIKMTLEGASGCGFWSQIARG